MSLGSPKTLLTILFVCLALFWPPDLTHAAPTYGQDDLSLPGLTAASDHAVDPSTPPSSPPLVPRRTLNSSTDLTTISKDHPLLRSRANGRVLESFQIPTLHDRVFTTSTFHVTPRRRRYVLAITSTQPIFAIAFFAIADPVDEHADPTYTWYPSRDAGGAGTPDAIKSYTPGDGALGGAFVVVWSFRGASGTAVVIEEEAERLRG